MDLALNNLQLLICHKLDQRKPNLTSWGLLQDLFNFDDVSSIAWDVLMTRLGFKGHVIFKFKFGMVN